MKKEKIRKDIRKGKFTLEFDESVMKEFRRISYLEGLPFRIIKKHLVENNRVFKICSGCEFTGKTHIHLFIPVKDKERLENYDEGSREQDYFEMMSFKNFKLFLEENGILDAIDEIILLTKRGRLK